MTKTDTQVAIASYCGAKITSNEDPNATWCSIGFPQLHLKLISKDKKSFFSFYSSKKTKKGEPVLGAWLKDNLESKFHSTEFSLKATPVKDEEGYVAEFDLGVRWDGWENLADAEKDKVKALYDRLAQFITSTWPTGGKQEENNTFMQWNERHPEKWHEYMRLRHLNVQDDQSGKDSKTSDARNLIYFGAPGTGKSFELNERVKADFTDKAGEIISERYKRVTFYPTYSYAQFVGCYKPVMESTQAIEKLSSPQLAKILKKAYAEADKGLQTAAVLLFAEQYYDSLLDAKSLDVVKQAGLATKKNVRASLDVGKRLVELKVARERSKAEIAYKFVPGPFLRVLVNALNEERDEDGKNMNWCLVIEEINRANAAAVFGDVFQLLDRNDKGESEYDVAASEDIRKYLAEVITSQEARDFLAVKTDDKGNWTECRLRIPSNMYIWATMNSADQGVFPMDTAFKRRWEFEYIKIDNGAPDCTDWTVEGKEYKWDDLRRIANELLSLHHVNEDKLMGAHFVKPTTGTKIIPTKSFESKVLMYLWEDAARMCRRQVFGTIKTFSDLLTAWENAGIKIFENDTEINNLKDSKTLFEKLKKPDVPDKPEPGASMDQPQP